MTTEEQIQEWCNTLPGWCTYEKAKRLYDLVAQTALDFKNDSLITVELGVFGGRSLFPMALAHFQANDGLAFGFDTWDNVAPISDENSPVNNEWWAKVAISDVRAQCYASLEQFGLVDYCGLFTMKTVAGAEKFLDKSVTLIHQDSSHNFTTISEELKAWAPKLAVGGFWVTDDNDWPETQKGYALLPEYGLELLENYGSWQVWRKFE